MQLVIFLTVTLMICSTVNALTLGRISRSLLRRNPSELSSAFSLRAGAASTLVTKAPVKMNGGALGAKLMEKTDVFIFDCDGVIWKGDSLIDGVPGVLDKLRGMGKKIFFVTNNSTKSRKVFIIS